jgi:G:T-mismatch repair DNA endonuclease (very short patch repair protein)
VTRSRFKCVFNCGTCGIVILKNKSQTAKITRGIAFCSLACLGVYNGKVKTNKIQKTCLICNKPYEVIPTQSEKSVACSRKCHSIWQSKYLIGDNANNYRGGNRTKKCICCGEDYECEKPSQVKTRKFCSKNCKNKYWTENTLHNKEFSKAWFIGNEKSRMRQAEGKETLPEKLVREWLQENNIEYIQEQGFFRKYFADFFVPKNNIIIEVMGDYWHGNPNIYGNNKKPLNNEQVNRIQKDKEKRSDFQKFGFKYYEIWESDIYENVDDVLNEIFPATTTRRTS